MTRKIFAATLAISLALGGASWWLVGATGARADRRNPHRVLASLLARDSMTRDSMAHHSVARDSMTRAVPASHSTVSRSVPAALVLHIDDCGSNLRYLRLLAPRADAPSIQVQRIVVASSLADSLTIRGSLPVWLRTVAFVEMTPVVSRALHGLGHSTSPILIVGDPMARVRLVTQPPRTSWEYTGFRKLVEALTWYEEM